MLQGHRSVDNLCKKRRTKERHREKERERGGERKRGRKFLERIYILPHFAVLGTFDALQGAFGGYGSSRRTLNAARGPRVRAVFWFRSRPRSVIALEHPRWSGQRGPGAAAGNARAWCLARTDEWANSTTSSPISCRGVALSSRERHFESQLPWLRCIQFAVTLAEFPATYSNECARALSLSLSLSRSLLLYSLSRSSERVHRVSPEL